MMTVEDLMRAAFNALLEGDLAARDRYCAQAKALMEGRVENPMMPEKPIVLSETEIAAMCGGENAIKRLRDVS